MFKCTISGITWKLSLLFPAVLLCLLTLDTDGLTLFCFCAAFLHECGHAVALWILHIKPRAVTLSFFGMRIELPPDNRMTVWQTVTVAAAGPLCNLLCAVCLWGYHAPAPFVAAHLVLAALNSLPIRPLDGGEITASLCNSVFSLRTAAAVMEWLFWCTWLLIGALGIAVCIYSGGNFTLLAVAIYIGCLRLFCKCN